MTAAERGAVVVTGRLLESAGRLDLLSTGLTLVGAATLMFTSSSSVGAVVVIIFGVIAKYYSLRIAFDARLFEDVASEVLSTEELDKALTEAGLAPDSKAGRSWSDRCRGAQRQVILFATVTLGQCIAIAATGIMRILER